MASESFVNLIRDSYTPKGESIIVGSAMLDATPIKESFIRIPLSTMNRHGLIAGATGTGKTKTLQVLAEQLSSNGVPSLLMDIKGDLSGIAAKAVISNSLQERSDKIGLPFLPGDSPVEFLTLADGYGIKLRATISEFGPVLFSRMLDLSETQEGVIAVIFKFCDDLGLPLVDLKDLKKVIQYITTDGKSEFEAQYGKVSTASTGTILRKLVELEQQGAELFFGEPSFDVNDLIRVDKDDRGMVSILRLNDIQDRPKLFSTFMLQLLAEVYAQFPEIGDVKKPKLVLFIDEAHLLFENASKALLDQIEVIIKLIRSKGIGIFFITQNPIDIPDSILSQLGLKIQHALRAFTAKDRKSIQKAAENFPETEYYDTDELITQMGIGEALVTVLNEKGIPTPLVHTYLRPPQSRMDVLTADELDEISNQSVLAKEYDEQVDKESAYELLSAKLEDASQQPKPEKTTASRKKEEKTTFEKILTNPTTRSIGNTVMREITRGVLGVLGVKTTRRRTTKKSPGWF